MPRGVDDVYVKPAGTTFVDGTVAEADDMNTLIDDIVTDLNTVRPLSMGGTGASTAAGGRSALGLDSMAIQADTSVDINGGAIDGTSVGITSAATGKFTTLTATAALRAADGDATTPSISFAADTNTGIYTPAENEIAITTSGAHRARVDGSGRFLVGPSDYVGTDLSDVGIMLQGAGASIPGNITCTASANSALWVNRITSDGTMVALLQDGTVQGSISVFGTTVSYNSFCGAHWSQLLDVSRQEIPRGTIVESIDEMCIWPGEENEQLPKFKTNDIPGSKAVYGVFMGWDEDDKRTNDAYIAGLGAYLVRIAADQRVTRGDLIEGDGKGCGRVQADDFFKPSTVAKVTSASRVETYDDGTYLVPCTLHCG